MIIDDRKLAPSILAEEGKIELICNGRSMETIMFRGDTLHIKKVEPSLLRVGDAVFCKVKGSYQVHKISAIHHNQWEISNNRGYVNGNIDAKYIYGLCYQVNDRVLLSIKELGDRRLQNVI